MLNKPNAKGQAISVVGNYLYALYIVSDSTGSNYQPSILVRLTIGTDGVLTYDAQAPVGMNATEIVPVTDASSAVRLLIPAIGGRQQAGTTNGTNSNISNVPAVGPWNYDEDNPVPVLVTGDPASVTNPSYDIRAIAAGMRGSNNTVYIMTGTYDEDYFQDWNVYRTTVAALLGQNNTALSNAGFNKVDGVEGSLGYFWDIVYEQTPDSNDAGDRIWAWLGSPVATSRAVAYGSPTASAHNPYAEFSSIGGINVNSQDLTIETINQASRKVSLKRGVKSIRAAVRAAKAAKEPEK
jgi:hypothetical protein